MMAHLRLMAVRDNGPSAALLSALGFGHGRQSAPIILGLSALHPNRSDEPYGGS
ncbi:MAG: hypothetical protein K2I26_07750 [Paramuribaculum sp.]|nr:hypothetical protein [Paramuribaculum sp.]